MSTTKLVVSNSYSCILGMQLSSKVIVIVDEKMRNNTTWRQTYEINCFYCTTHRADRPPEKALWNIQQLHNCKTELRRKEESQSRLETSGGEITGACLWYQKQKKNTLLEITVTTLSDLLMSVWQRSVQGQRRKQTVRLTTWMNVQKACVHVRNLLRIYRRDTEGYIFTVVPFQKQPKDHTQSLLPWVVDHSKGRTQ